MKVVKTTAVGSFITLAGAAILWWYGPLMLESCVVTSPAPANGNGSQLSVSAPLSAIGVMAFVLGLLTAVCGIANASRYGGVSAPCRKLILIAGAATVASAGLMLLATARFFLFARDLLGSPDPHFFVRSHKPPGFDLLCVSFALLAAVAVLFFAASRFCIGQQPPKRLNRSTAVGVSFVVIAGLAFGEAFRESCLSASRWYYLITFSDPRDAYAPLYSISAAQVCAGACLLALGAAIAAFALLCPGKSKAS